MNEIVVRKLNRTAPHNNKTTGSFLDERIGFWGNINAADSVTNRVDVVADTGQIFVGIPVVSDEWVNKDENKDYVTGSRALPPKGSRVFVLTPTHTIAGAFVLCSGYATGETSTQTLFANDSTRNEKNNINEKVSQGGWNCKEYHEDGNLIYLSKDNKIKIEVNLANNGSDIKKGVRLTAWDNVIEITENGVSFDIKSNITIKAENKTINVNCQEFNVNNGNLKVN